MVEKEQLRQDKTQKIILAAKEKYKNGKEFGSYIEEQENGWNGTVKWCCPGTSIDAMEDEYVYMAEVTVSQEGIIFISERTRSGHWNRFIS